MGHQSCCVVNCKNTGRNSTWKFYSFPIAEWKLGQRKQWIEAVRRQNVDGSPWIPSRKDYICSEHFVGGRKSEEELSPNYIPTIFPPIYKSTAEGLFRHKHFKQCKLGKKFNKSKKDKSIILKNNKVVKNNTVLGPNSTKDKQFHLGSIAKNILPFNADNSILVKDENVEKKQVNIHFQEENFQFTKIKTEKLNSKGFKDVDFLFVDVNNEVLYNGENVEIEETNNCFEGNYSEFVKDGSIKIEPCDLDDNLNNNSELVKDVNIKIEKLNTELIIKDEILEYEKACSLRNRDQHKILSVEKPYLCDICNIGFIQESNLIEHKRIHTGEKPFTCDMCSKTFAWEISLIQHKKIHKKTYICEVCYISFTKQKDLILHKEIHNVKDGSIKIEACNNNPELDVNIKIEN